MMASMSARICRIRSSSGAVSIGFWSPDIIGFISLPCIVLPEPQRRQFLPDTCRLVLRTAQRLFAPGFVGHDIDLQIVRQRFEAPLAVIEATTAAGR